MDQETLQHIPAPWQRGEYAVDCTSYILLHAGLAQAMHAIGYIWSADGVPDSFDMQQTEIQFTFAALLREIVNPFAPATLDLSLLTSTVIALANGIHQERAFERLPILVDALQDAGCDNATILDHLRGEAGHVRGCWVVDAVLRKE